MQKFPIYAHSCVKFVRLIICGPAAREERHDKQQYYRACHRGQQRAECSHSNPAPQSYEPAAQETANDTDDNIEQKPCAATAHNKVGEPSCYQAYKQIP